MWKGMAGWGEHAGACRIPGALAFSARNILSAACEFLSAQVTWEIRSGNVSYEIKGCGMLAIGIWKGMTGGHTGVPP